MRQIAVIKVDHQKRQHAYASKSIIRSEDERSVGLDGVMMFLDTFLSTIPREEVIVHIGTACCDVYIESCWLDGDDGEGAGFACVL